MKLSELKAMLRLRAERALDDWVKTPSSFEFEVRRRIEAYVDEQIRKAVNEQLGVEAWGSPTRDSAVFKAVAALVPSFTERAKAIVSGFTLDEAKLTERLRKEFDERFIHACEQAVYKIAQDRARDFAARAIESTDDEPPMKPVSPDQGTVLTGEIFADVVLDELCGDPSLARAINLRGRDALHAAMAQKIARLLTDFDTKKPA